MSLILIFLLMFGGSLAILKYTFNIVNMVGHNDWAERHLGPGGSYTLWKLVGIGIMILSVLYVTGTINLNPNDSAQKAKQNPEPQIQEIK